MRAIDVVSGQLLWGEQPEPAVGPGQLLLQVRSTSVNRADLLQAAGYYPPPPGAPDVLGLEAAGVVVRGAGPYQPGDAVMALLGGGGYAERVAVDPRHVLPIPGSIGLPDAGGVMEVFLTAWLNLVVLGRLRAGQRVLIHGGSGGVGVAALQLARHLGAEVWTTARGPKQGRCLQLGAHHAHDWADDDWSQAVTAAGGADLILDCIGAGYLDRNLRALAPDGQLVVIGLQKGAVAELNLGLLLSRRLRVQGSTLRALPADRKAALVADFHERAWPLLDDGTLTLPVHARMPLPQAEEAHALMRVSGHIGKILLVNETAQQTYGA